LAAIRFVAPKRLDGKAVAAQADVLQTGPGALVAVLAGLDVVPAILGAHLIVGIGHGFGIFVTGDDAVAVQVPVAECIVGLVDRVAAAAGALFGHVRHEGIANTMAADVSGL
jgi:hypothetical protein